MLSPSDGCELQVTTSIFTVSTLIHHESRAKKCENLRDDAFTLTALWIGHAIQGVRKSKIDGDSFALPVSKPHGFRPITPTKFSGQPIAIRLFATCFGLCKGALGGCRQFIGLVGHLNSPCRQHGFDIPRLHPASRDTQ
jgi:hypothetical protein